MSQARIQRFDFSGLRDFRGPIIMRADKEELVVDLPPPPPPAPVFSEAQLEAARHEGRKQGYNEGFLAGKLDTQKDFERHTEDANKALSQLAELLTNLNARYHAMLAHESAQLGQLLTMIAQKVTDVALDARGLETIEAMVTRSLPVLLSKPRISIDLNPEMMTVAMPRIETKLQAEGFEGEIQFRGNPDLASSDITLDWGTGRIARSTNDIWEEISALIERIPLEITFTETLNTTGD